MKSVDEMKSKVDVVASGRIGGEVTLSTGDTVPIYKCAVRDVGSVLGLLNTVMVSFGIEKLGDVPKLDFENPTIMLQMIAKCSDAFADVAPHFCGLPEGMNFDALGLDDAIAIILEEVRVNKDFFMEKVLPLAMAAMAKSGLFV